MEGELNLPIDLSKQNHPTMEGFQDRHIQSSFIWANPYINTIAGLPMFQGVPPSVKDLQPDLGLAHLSSLQPFSGQQLCDVSSLQPFCSGFSDPSSSTRTPAINYGLQADQLGENMVSNDWMSQNYMNLCLAEQVSNANNELSLRLSAYGGPSINNQCSDMSGSDQQGSRGNASGKQSMSCGLNRKAPQLSQIVSQPRYLGVVQEILSQFASFSLENMDQQLTTAPYLDHCAEQGDSFKGSDESSNLGGVMEARDSEAKRSQLLALLQMLDDCYNQCLDEVHTVISAFHAATELDPHRHACFALRTISVLYKSLKGRISNQILRMGAYDEMGNGSDGGGASGSCSRDQMERSFEKSFIQKQWALQQLKKKDMQLWRPQRGLPERSVSVLRAWMFQNFLHPYPKDAEKHLLAIKSGLTRSQVSNWFINARVRLWKPLIEEMYAELNRSRAGNSNQGNEESNTYNCLSIHNSRYSTS